ncbi:MAG: FtsQ-type POTRA domain-containing protein [Kiritimatiellae bacterium]|nr:FtsQ-type POTRA domain-containing protein [Kiritimatiellia bacterium]
MDVLNAIPGNKRSGNGKKAKKGATSWSMMQMPSWVFVLGVGMLALGVLVSLFWAFKTCYYDRNAAFTVAVDDISVSGNATVTRDYILNCFDINGPRNGFDLVDSEIVHRLQTQMPILKSAQMTYTSNKKVEIWVEERMPLARIAGSFLVVDDEGVLFSYTRSTSSLPEIGGFDLLDEELVPGKRLPSQLHCMLRLLLTVSDTSRFFNSAVKRVTLLGIDPEDGLRVTLLDGRKIDIAWENMATETEVSEGMVRRLRNVAHVLKSSTAVGKKHFNAMAIDRTSMSD